MGLYSHIDKYTRLCLGTFEYIEADREIYKKNGLQNPKNIPQHFMYVFLIILHIVSLSVCLTFTTGIGCVALWYANTIGEQSVPKLAEITGIGILDLLYTLKQNIHEYSNVTCNS